MTFPIEDYLALPMTPCIRVHIHPDRAIDVSLPAFEAGKQDLIDFCLSIPEAQLGCSWRTLLPYVGDNPTMAKLLVALGHLADVWTMHPRMDIPDLWNKSKDYPMILADTAKSIKRTSVPKPSAGDLEVGVGPCLCCDDPMGPKDSKIHDRYEVADGMCTECAAEGCELDEDCKKNAEVINYLKQFM
jgi:hypothetical protein